MPPVIGVSRCDTVADYLEAVRRCGAEPRVLDLDRDVPARVLREIDGLLLTGGPDIEPERYGEPREPAVTNVSADRDAFEIALAQLAVAADLPTLAICRGLQVLNVAFGGTLIQDIPSQVPNALGHTIADSRVAIAHDVWIGPDSLLAGAMADRSSDERPALETKELSRAVNSRHHQAAKRLAEGFVIGATAPDGIVEAIERPASRFCLAVQWHPENFWRTGEFRPLFEAFVRACEEQRR